MLEMGMRSVSVRVSKLESLIPIGLLLTEYNAAYITESARLNAPVENPSDVLTIQAVEATLETLELAKLGKQRILLDRGTNSRAAVVMSVVKSVSDSDSRYSSHVRGVMVN